jgi:RNA polymerase sigma factor (sigma-70 family)
LVPLVVTVSDSAAPQPEPTTLPVTADLERLRGGLRIIALRALGDADAAEEAVQETFARAVVALADSRLDDPAKLAAYVAGIARHVCSHVLRDRKQTVSLDGADVAGAPSIHPQLAIWFDPLEALISAAETERLRVAFSTLSPADQRLLRLCYHEDRTPSEVAAALAEPADRVRKRKSRALERLRRAFLGHAEGHDEPSSGTAKKAPLMPTDHRGKKDHD